MRRAEVTSVASSVLRKYLTKRKGKRRENNEKNQATHRVLASPLTRCATWHRINNVAKPQLLPL